MRTNYSHRIFFAILLVVLVSCQKETQISTDQSEQFIKFFGGSEVDKALSVVETKEGFALTGTIFNGVNKSKAFLIATDKYGNGLSWSPVLLGDSIKNCGNRIIRTSGNEFLIVGFSEVLSANKQNKDWMVVKLSESGEIQWQKRFGGGFDDEASDVIETKSGNYLIVGYTESKGQGLKDAWAIMLNQNGVVLWEKTSGGTGNDSYKTLIETNNSYILAGSTDSWHSGSFDRSVFFVKIDNSTTTGDPSDFNFYGGISESSDVKMIKYNGAVFVMRDVSGSVPTTLVTSLMKVGENFNQFFWDKKSLDTNKSFATLLVKDGKLCMLENKADVGGDDFLLRELSFDGNLLNTKEENIPGSQVQNDAILSAEGKLIVVGANVIDKYSKIFIRKFK